MFSPQYSRSKTQSMYASKLISRVQRKIKNKFQAHVVVEAMLSEYSRKKALRKVLRYSNLDTIITDKRDALFSPEAAPEQPHRPRSISPSVPHLEHDPAGCKGIPILSLVQ